jgi:rubrerythrin
MKWALIAIFSMAFVLIFQRFRAAKVKKNPILNTVSAQFKRLRRQVIIVMILTGLMGFVYGNAMKRPMEDSRQLLDNFLFLLLIVVGVVFIILGWRCPKCKKLLWKYVNPDKCPFCDASYRD